MGDKSPPPPKAIYAFFGELVVNETFINVSKRFYPFINVLKRAGWEIVLILSLVEGR